MLYVLPPAITHFQDSMMAARKKFTSQNVHVKEKVDFTYLLLAMLDALESMWPHLVVKRQIRQDLAIVGKSKSEHVPSLLGLKESIRTLESVSAELAGFSYLFKEALEEGEICEEETLEFEFLDRDAKDKLASLQSTLRSLQAYVDFSQAFEVSCKEVASCIVILGLIEAIAEKQDSLEVLLLQEARTYLQNRGIGDIVLLLLEAYTSGETRLPAELQKPFAMLYLVMHVAYENVETHNQCKTLDGLLQANGLPNVSTLKQAGFFYKEHHGS